MDEEFFENEEFFEYVDNGYLENVKKSIEKYNIDPSVNNNEAIRWASNNGHFEIVKYLMSLDKKYNIDPSANDNEAIQKASANGHLNVVEYLMSLDEKYNIDPSATHNYAIRQAFEYGHLKVVKYLMSLDKKYNIDPSADNNYSICFASANGHLEMVRYLMSLDEKYNIDPSADNNLAIRLASYYKHLDIIKLLSTYYSDKLPISENDKYDKDINDYIKEFNKNPLEMNRKMKLYYFNNDLKYYSLAILFNDDYLTLEDNCDKDIEKFFNINKELNNDILMLLINILVNNNKIIISSNDFNSFIKDIENIQFLFFDNEK